MFALLFRVWTKICIAFKLWPQTQVYKESAAVCLHNLNRGDHVIISLNRKCFHQLKIRVAPDKTGPLFPANAISCNLAHWVRFRRYLVKQREQGLLYLTVSTVSKYFIISYSRLFRTVIWVSTLSEWCSLCEVDVALCRSNTSTHHHTWVPVQTRKWQHTRNVHKEPSQCSPLSWSQDFNFVFESFFQMPNSICRRILVCPHSPMK